MHSEQVGQQQRTGGQEGYAMARMEMMPLAQEFGVGGMKTIQDAVAYIQQPCGKGEGKCLQRRKVKMHGVGKEPGPERGDRGSIQAEQMPPGSEICNAKRHRSVYCDKKKE